MYIAFLHKYKICNTLHCYTSIGCWQQHLLAPFQRAVHQMCLHHIPSGLLSFLSPQPFNVLKFVCCQHKSRSTGITWPQTFHSASVNIFWLSPVRCLCPTHTISLLHTTKHAEIDYYKLSVTFFQQRLLLFSLHLLCFSTAAILFVVFVVVSGDSHLNRAFESKLRHS